MLLCFFCCRVYLALLSEEFCGIFNPVYFVNSAVNKQQRLSFDEDPQNMHQSRVSRVM